MVPARLAEEGGRRTRARDWRTEVNKKKAEERVSHASRRRPPSQVKRPEGERRDRQKKACVRTLEQRETERLSPQAHKHVADMHASSPQKHGAHSLPGLASLASAVHSMGQSLMSPGQGRLVAFFCGVPLCPGAREDECNGSGQRTHVHE